MHIETEAIVCSLLAHGEHGAVVRLLTPDHGLVAAYVRGGRGRRMRPVLIPGNSVSAQLRSRTESQLPQASVELVHSRAPMLTEALALSAIEWVTALAAAALAERQPYPRLYSAMAGLLDAIEAAPSARGWGGALVQFEQLVIAELGYGISEQPGGKDDRRDFDWLQVIAALDRSTDSLFGNVLSGGAGALHDSRGRLIERLRRLVAQ
jgi:DNA repair protein RecO (recombination protein O)